MINNITEIKTAFTFKKEKLILFLSIFYSIIIANFVFIGGLSLGFFITILIGQVLILLVFPLPKSKQNFYWGMFFSVSILSLSFCFFLFSDVLLALLNLLVILLLVFMQILIYSEAAKTNWDTVHFIKSLSVSFFARFFVSIPKLGATVKDFSNRENKLSQDKGTVAKYIFLGLLITLPIMFVVVLLLASADMIFRSYAYNVEVLLRNISSQEIFKTIIISALLFPFIFSFVHSHYYKWRENFLNENNSFYFLKKISINPIIISTLLFSLNLLYGFFSYIQFKSLFGAFEHKLPEQITYAEYAREGFFQLAAVSFINILVIILTVTLIKQNGIGRIFAKIMSVLLIGFTYLLMASALYRMYMYIDVYALTKLRVFVTLFMFLIALILVLTTIKEFLPSFKFVKYSFIIALLVLVMTNYLNVNNFIAKYNIDSNNIGQTHLENMYVVDADYLLYDLSYDSIPILVEYVISENSQPTLHVKRKLLKIYENNLENYSINDFRQFNLSKYKAKLAIEELLE